MNFTEPSYIDLLEENNRLQNEIDELKESLNNDSNFDLDKINDMIKTEISEHIKQYLVFDLDKINEMIRYEITKHIKDQICVDYIGQNEMIRKEISQNVKDHICIDSIGQNEMKDNIKQNISKYNVNKNMLFDIKLTNQDKNKKNYNNIKKENIKKENIKKENIKKENIKIDTDIKPICNLKLVNDIIKEENMDLCVISHGGCCSNQLVDILTDNGYNIRTPIWENILCHCPEYINIDIPIIYIYGNPLNSFLSVKKRGDGFWNSNQKKLSNNENTRLSDENLLKLMIKQTNTWINIKKENVLILKSSEIFEEPIIDKLQSFLKKDLHSFPITYVKPKTSLENLDKDELMLFQKYKNDINKIIKKYLYDL